VVAVSGRSGRWLWSYPVDEAFKNLPQSGWSQPASAVRGRGPVMVAYVDGTRWIGLDAATGRPLAGPIDLGFEPVRPVQYPDFDGDGEPEILGTGPGRGAKKQMLAAFSRGTGHALWVEQVNDTLEGPSLFEIARDWPLVVDVEGDGRAEVVVPDSGPM